MGKQNAHLMEQKEEIAFIFLILRNMCLDPSCACFTFLYSPGAELHRLPTFQLSYPIKYRHHVILTETSWRQLVYLKV